MLNIIKWWEKIYYPIYRFVNHYIDYRWFIWWYQRLTRGFSSRALWSLDYTITEFILPRLKAFRKGGTCGYPGYQEEFRERIDADESGEWDKELSKEMYNAWLGKLDKMILAFEYMKLDGEDIDNGIKGYTIKNSLMKIDCDESKRSTYSEEMERRQVIIDEGLLLFAKYYQNLWD